MEFLYSREYLSSNQYVRVDCDTQCNVMLLDDINFAAYKTGDDYRFYGGFFKKFPAVFPAPYPGHWNIAIDLGGARATIKYKISILTIPT